jgi:signal transduction histidine kinase
MALRTLYKIDGWILLVIGFAFWGCWPFPLRWLGMDFPEWNAVPLNFWKFESFAGTFGGALMAFGFAALAVGRSHDRGFLETASGYFVGAHCFLGFIVFAKDVALWDNLPADLLFNLVAFPAAGFLYFRVAAFRHAGAPGARPRSDRELAIREAAGQEERARLAQDLHDSVKQQIYSIQANLAAAEVRLGTDPEGARGALDESRKLARDAMAEMMALLDRLRADPIESVGLVEALRRQCEALGYQTGAIVVTNFGNMPAGERLPPGAMKSAFRIAQEGLANVARHARASNVQVEAGTDAAGSEFILRIHDDGQGFDTQAATGGMGLANMRARATEIGARLELRSIPGSGTEAALHLRLLDARSAQLRKRERLTAAVALPLALLVWAALPWPMWRLNGTELLMFAPVFLAAEALALALPRWR